MYGRILFYLKLHLFLLFLAFLTGYVIMTTPSKFGVKLNGKLMNCTITEDNDSLAFDVFVEKGRFILLILACVHLLFEVRVLKVTLLFEMLG